MPAAGAAAAPLSKAQWMLACLASLVAALQVLLLQLETVAHGELLTDSLQQYKDRQLTFAVQAFGQLCALPSGTRCIVAWHGHLLSLGSSMGIALHPWEHPMLLTVRCRHCAGLEFQLQLWLLPGRLLVACTAGLVSCLDSLIQSCQLLHATSFKT